MQITYSIIIVLLTILLFIELFFFFEKQNFVLRVQNKIKKLIDFLFILFLTGLSIIGCITTLNNYQIYFMVIYIASYFFLKEVYSKIIIERRQTIFKIQMQKIVESEFSFNEIFSQVDCKLERNNLKAFFNIKNSIEKKHWINAYSDGVIGISFNNQRHFFSLRNKEWIKGLDYLIAQLEFIASDINSVEDLNNVKLKIINNNHIAENLVHYFVPYNQKQENLKKPAIFNDVLFNLTIMSGYIVGSILINLIFSWLSLSLFIKIISIFAGIVFSIEFILGIIVVFGFCIDTLKSPKAD